MSTKRRIESASFEHPANKDACERSFLVSYPRSGSNFFQEILKTKYRLGASSLYGDDVQSSNKTNLKSHAISYAYLKDECNFILGDDEKPHKIITMYRDPRDVMISFFNFFNSYNQGEIAQNDFLSLDWFLVLTRTPNTRTWLRSTHQNPVNIAESYQIFVDSWFVNKNISDNTIMTTLRYDDLVAQPELVVSKALAALNLNCVPAGESNEATSLVSTISAEDRPRGCAQGWKRDDVYMKYKVLIDQVEKRLGDEIAHLSY